MVGVRDRVLKLHMHIYLAYEHKYIYMYVQKSQTRENMQHILSKRLSKVNSISRSRMNCCVDKTRMESEFANKIGWTIDECIYKSNFSDKLVFVRTYVARKNIAKEYLADALHSTERKMKREREKIRNKEKEIPNLIYMAAFKRDTTKEKSL